MDTYRTFIESQAAIFKALGHPTRLMMVDALRKGERCVCDLQRLVGDDMSTISKHLAVLKNAGVVRAEKRGTSMFYTLRICCLDSFLSCTEELIRSRTLSSMEVIRKMGERN